MKKNTNAFNVRIILVTVALLLVIVGATYAWWTTSLNKNQIVNLGKLSLAASFPELSDDELYEPGLTVEIDGVVKNTGSIPVIMKILNTSEIKFNFNDNYVPDNEEAIALSISPQSGSFDDNPNVYWLSVQNDPSQRFVIMDIGSELALSVLAELSGDKMDNRYQEATIKIGTKLNGTQVLEGAIKSEFNVAIEELVGLNDATNLRSSTSRSLNRLYELVNR